MALALITGARSLIGQGIAAALAEDGWRLALTDIDGEWAADAAVRLPGATGYRMDVTDEGEVAAVVERVLADEGAIDGLVNAAGGLRGLGIARKPFVESTPAEWRRVLDVNLYGTLTVTAAVLPAMIREGRGLIASISSSRGLRGAPGTGLYSAAKAGIILFTQTMAADCAAHGIRINSVAPGNTEAAWKADPGGGAGLPLGPASGRDVGDAVAFLFSDRARHITGACIDVSGGSALH